MAFVKLEELIGVPIGNLPDVCEIDPDHLMALDDVDEMLSIVKNVDSWKDHHVQLFDGVYAGRVVQALVSPINESRLRQFREHLRIVVAHMRDVSLSPESMRIVASWRGYTTILDIRLSGLSTRNPRAILRRRVVQQVVAALKTKRGSMTRAEIATATARDEAILVGVLNLMARNDIVTLHWAGQDLHVALVSRE